MANGDIREQFLRFASERGLAPPQESGDLLNQFTSYVASQGLAPPSPYNDEVRRANREATTRGERRLEGLRQLAAGAIDSALLSPAQALLEIPGFVAESEIDVYAERLRAYREGITEARERRAFQVGMTEREAAFIGITGEIIGFTAPAVGALKLGALVRGSRTILPFDPVQDVTAGLIFGGVLTPNEDAVERAKSAAMEGGLFGAVGIVARGAVFPLLRYRNARIQNRADDLALQGRIKELGGDRPPLISSERDNIPGLIRQLNEEDWIVNSPAAQRILERNAEETAVAQAILDVAGNSGNVGVVRGVRDPTDIITRFEAEFPAFRGKMQAFRSDNPLRPERMRGNEGTFDIYFGTTALSSGQRAQIAREGYFEGQKILYTRGSIEGSYVRRVGKEHIAFKDSTGKLRKVKESNIKDLPYGIAPDARAPQFDALYKDFDRFYSETADKLVAAQSGMSPEDFIRGLREGRITLDDTARRMVNEPYAIIMPEDAGLTPQFMAEALEAANLRRAEIGLPPIPMNEELVARTGVEFVRPNTIDRVTNFDDIFDAWARDRGFLIDQVENVSDMSAQAGAMIPGRRFARGPSWDASTVASTTPTGEGSMPVTLSRVRRISTQPADLESARVHFAEKVRQDLLRQVPTEDKVIFTRIQDQLVKVGEEIPDSLVARAARVGFHASQRSDGSVILREINTGMKLPFAAERDAMEALEHMTRLQRSARDGSIIPDIAPGGTTSPGLLRNVDGELLDPNLGYAQLAREGVSGRALTNMVDWVVNIDRDFGTPIFRYVDPLIKGHANVVQETAPWNRLIDKAFKGWNQNELNQLGTYLTRLEETALERGVLLSRQDKLRMAREMGLPDPARFAAKSDEINRMTRSMARIYGIEEERIIPEYYGRIRPYAEKHGATLPDDISDTWQWAQQMMRTGEMSSFELNPAIMLTKWIRGASTHRHVAPHWESLAKVVGTKGKPGMVIGDLTPAQREAMVKRIPEFRDIPENVLNARSVLPDQIADTLREFLTMTRGMPSSSMESSRRAFKGFFKHLGVNMEERVLDDYVNVTLSSMYGAAMGLRVMQTARNLTQPTYLTGTRLGFRDSGPAMKRALTLEGFKEVADEGVIRAVAGGGIPQHDLVFERTMGQISGEGLMGVAFASAARSALRVGNLSRKTAEKFLIPYTATDELNRAWSYHWYKQHTQRVLSKFEGGAITQAKFLDDLAPGMARNLKEEALRIRNREGNERFLRTIARWGTDQDAFIYGASVQPPWMQHPFGRFVGMFGTWPLWLKSHQGRVINNMTRGQQAAYALRTSAVTGSLVLTGYSMGVNMWNWIAPLSLFNFSGGPATDWIIDAKRLIEAPIDQKASAAYDLVSNMGGLALPGQIFYREMVRSVGVAENPAHAALLMGLGRPLDEDHWFIDQMLEQRPVDRIKRAPSVQRWLDNEDGFFEFEPATPRALPPGLPIRLEGSSNLPPPS